MNETDTTNDETRTDDGPASEASGTASELRSDGGETGIVAPDDETPTWSERKERKSGLSRLTYEYFERARREDQDLRNESDYVERDVLGFPTWPHEIIRNLDLDVLRRDDRPDRGGAAAEPRSA